jgi:hypothetical protein
MKLANLKRAIEKRGGEATVTQETLTDRYTGRDWPHWELSGTLNGHDVSMTGSNGTDSCGFYTTRAIAKRGHYDMGSDYNPGGWTFCNRLKDLEWACR